MAVTGKHTASTATTWLHPVTHIEGKPLPMSPRSLETATGMTMGQASTKATQASAEMVSSGEHSANATARSHLPTARSKPTSKRRETTYLSVTLERLKHETDTKTRPPEPTLLEPETEEVETVYIKKPKKPKPVKSKPKKKKKVVYVESSDSESAESESEEEEVTYVKRRPRSSRRSKPRAVEREPPPQQEQYVQQEEYGYDRDHFGNVLW